MVEITYAMQISYQDEKAIVIPPELVVDGPDGHQVSENQIHCPSHHSTDLWDQGDQKCIPCILPSPIQLGFHEEFQV